MNENSPLQRVVVVIPCYNEALSVGKVVEDFAKALPEAEIYVFDNNSTDATAERARDAGATVIPPRLQGKENVIRHVARTLDADIFVIVDGNATYPADAAPEMLERLRADGPPKSDLGLHADSRRTPQSGPRDWPQHDQANSPRKWTGSRSASRKSDVLGELPEGSLGAISATDFFSVELLTRVGLVRYFVLFVIDLKTRRVEIAGIVRQPDGE